MTRPVCVLLCEAKNYPESIGDGYDRFYWCRNCGHAVPHEDAENVKGKLRCPCCYNQLRLSSRYSRKNR